MQGTHLKIIQWNTNIWATTHMLFRPLWGASWTPESWKVGTAPCVCTWAQLEAQCLSSSAPSRPVWIWAASHAIPVCPCSLARGHCPVISPESQNLGAGRGLGAHWFSPVFSSQSYWGLQRKDASSGINTHSHEPYGWKPCVFVSVPKKKREAWDFLEVYFSW